jgi:hypothetical protein
VIWNDATSVVRFVMFQATRTTLKSKARELISTLYRPMMLESGVGHMF